MKKILITGGAGFIGSHLAKNLIQQGNKISIIDRFNANNIALKKDRLNKFLDPKDYEFYEIDLADMSAMDKLLKKKKFDIICHLAAKTSLDNTLYNPKNYYGTSNLFELAKINNIPKIVFASSSMVYGNNIKQPFNERDNTDKPLSLYAASKKYDELLAYVYHNLYRIQMVGIRFFTTYGPWGRPDMSISRFTEKILKNEQIELHNHGDNMRDYTYIDDVIDGIVKIINKEFEYEIFNMGSGTSTSLNEILKFIEIELNMIADKKYIDMQPGDLVSTWADLEKSRQLLDYNPMTTIEDGIKKYINWYKEYYQYG